MRNKRIAIALLFVLIPGVAFFLVNVLRDGPRPLSSFDQPVGWAGKKVFDPGQIEFKEADLTQVLEFYKKVSGRPVQRGTNLTKVTVTLRNETPLNRVETLQLLDTALALNRVRMVLEDDGTMKAMDWAPGTNEAAPKMSASLDSLPDSSSYLSVRVRLKNAGRAVVISALRPFSNLPASVTVTEYVSFLGIPVCPARWIAGRGKSSGVLPLVNVVTLRDYSSNVRQMLQFLAFVDPTNGPQPRLKAWRSAASEGCFSALDSTDGAADTLRFAPGEMRFENSELQAVLDLYQKISGRTVIRSSYGASAAPSARISLRNERSLNRVQALRLLDTELAYHGVAMLPCGDKLVKAVGLDSAAQNCMPILSPDASLPDSRSCILTSVRLRKADPGLVRQMITKAGLKESIIVLPWSGDFIFRSYATNVAEMLKIVRQAER
jgi:type II secretory pathway component GspD/PulD (secretin)